MANLTSLMSGCLEPDYDFNQSNGCDLAIERQKHSETIDEIDQMNGYIESLKKEMDIYYNEFYEAVAKGESVDINIYYWENQSILHEMGIEYDSKEAK